LALPDAFQLFRRSLCWGTSLNNGGWYYGGWFGDYDIRVFIGLVPFLAGSKKRTASGDDFRGCQTEALERSAITNLTVGTIWKLKVGCY
jgi:hypothetical protein